MTDVEAGVQQLAEHGRSMLGDDEDNMTSIDLEADTPAASDIGGPELPPADNAAGAGGGEGGVQGPNAAPPALSISTSAASAGNGSHHTQNGAKSNGVSSGTSAAPGTTQAPPAAPVHPGQLDPTMRFWFPALFSFYDIIMASDDLEVRRLALASLFDLLKQHGHSFPSEFWDTICKEILFPIFSVLRRPSAAAGTNAGGTGAAQTPTSASASPSHKFAALPPVAGPSSSVASAGSGIHVLQEEMSVWLSTTMIQALRNLVDLWTHFFGELERLLPELLELLCACICQENDTLARIGTSCLQSLVEKNVDKLSPKRWEQVVDALVSLFNTTTAHALFDPALRAVAPEPGTPGYAEFFQADARLNAAHNAALQSPSPFDSPYEYSFHYQQQFPPRPPMSSAERRRAFKQIIVKCVLQLLLIETTQELLNGPAASNSANTTPRTGHHRPSDASSTAAGIAQARTPDALSHVLPPQESPASAFYSLIPPTQLLRLTHVLEASYAFSRAFNADKELRLALWKVGFMKQLPNLLKQESSSAATLVRVLVRMHADPREGHRGLRKEVRRRLVPLGREVVKGYLPLDPDTQARNIGAWTPVVADIFRGLCTFQDDEMEVLDEHGRVAGVDSASTLRAEKGKPLRRKSGHAFDFSIDDDEDLLLSSSPELGEAKNHSPAAVTTPGRPKAYGVFSTHARTFYPLAVELLSKDPLPPEVGESLRHYFWKVGLSVGFVDLTALRAERERERERERLEEERREVLRARERELDRERARIAEETRLRREQEERERERRRWEAQRLAQAQAQVERDQERQRIQAEREQIQREREQLQRQMAAEQQQQQQQDQAASQPPQAQEARPANESSADDAPPVPSKAIKSAAPAPAESQEAAPEAEHANGSAQMSGQP
ncbi:guanine nucleotide exchange protein for ADP-robosylation factor [Tilletia horrida]|nr:guanine nucleotide exchange protein for ADP-robosylation factor [Tilletia horrida]